MPASELDLILNSGGLCKILRQISTDVFYQVIEKDAETDRKKAVIEAEKEAQVAKIRYFIIQSQLHFFLHKYLFIYLQMDGSLLLRIKFCSVKV